MTLASRCTITFCLTPLVIEFSFILCDVIVCFTLMMSVYDINTNIIYIIIINIHCLHIFYHCSISLYVSYHLENYIHIIGLDALFGLIN